MDQVIGINMDINPDEITDGMTILLPAGKLSSRDKEILDGIGTTYRLYPVRAGESLADVIAKRGITMEEMEELNPGINLNKIKGRQQKLALWLGQGQALSNQRAAAARDFAAQAVQTPPARREAPASVLAPATPNGMRVGQLTIRTATS